MYTNTTIIVSILSNININMVLAVLVIYTAFLASCDFVRAALSAIIHTTAFLAGLLHARIGTDLGVTRHSIADPASRV